MPVPVIIIIVIFGLIIAFVVWKWIWPKIGPLFGVTPPPPPPPVVPPTPPPIITPPVPPVPSVPTLSFVNAPNEVVAGVRTSFIFATDYSGAPARRERTKIEISVPSNNGVLTALVGNGPLQEWEPSEGTIMGMQDTAASDFPTVGTGQIRVEIYIDHVTPDGDPPDCTLTATNIDSGVSVTTKFKGISPP